MKKYQVTNGKKALGPVDNGDKAAAMLIQCLTVEMLAGDDPTKWRIEELDDEEKAEQPKDTPELILDIKAARDYLDVNYVELMIDETSWDSLRAIDQLLTLAKAWNKADGFVPDWNDREQLKYTPLFEQRDGRWDFADNSHYGGATNFAARLICFKTWERADQFASQFVDLFREALK